MKRRAINEVGSLDESSRRATKAESYCRLLKGAGYVLGLALDTYVVHYPDVIGIHAHPSGREGDLSTGMAQELTAQTS